jgi:hypothetical protein
MIEDIDEFSNIVNEVQNLLSLNQEWVKRYGIYAQNIDVNHKKIKEKKKEFNEWSPLYLYMTLTEAKGRMAFSLRYFGQEVATLKTNSDNTTISTTKYDDSNKRDFNCPIELDNKSWRSEEAKDFRRHFSGFPLRTDKSGKQNNEHRIESLLLTEFSRANRIEKIISNIQPVKLAGIARFQMPTPLRASDINNVTYADWHGGGIDILTRIGTGGATKLCVMEVKDENVPKEPPGKAIQQALAYATFLGKLLKSESGQQWWNIFGFNGDLPGHLDIYVCCVMPSIENNDTSFSGKMINLSGDNLLLDYIYFNERDNCIVDIESSLKLCETK